METLPPSGSSPPKQLARLSHAPKMPAAAGHAAVGQDTYPPLPPRTHAGEGGRQHARLPRLFLAPRDPQARSPCCPRDRSDSDSDTLTEGLPCSGRRGLFLVPRTDQRAAGVNPAARPFCWSWSLSFSDSTTDHRPPVGATALTPRTPGVTGVSQHPGQCLAHKKGSVNTC